MIPRAQRAISALFQETHHSRLKTYPCFFVYILFFQIKRFCQKNTFLGFPLEYCTFYNNVKHLTGHTVHRQKTAQDVTIFVYYRKKVFQTILL
jgi:hypothetical protein